MIVEIAPGADAATLVAQDDFKALKVVAAPGEDETRILALLQAEAAAEAGHLWIPAETLRRLASRSSEWDMAFAAMLAKVEPFGWYDAAGDKVKAHIERSA